MISQNAVVDVICGGGDYSCQIYTNVIPQVGSCFTFASSRDENGDYVRDDQNPRNICGKVTEKFRGLVKSVEYFYEETGNCSQNCTQTMYVKIICSKI